MAVMDKLRSLRIKANLMADESVGLMEIDTDVREGVAVLTGEVDTEEQKRIAEELAQETEGIVEVHNDLRVVPGSSERLIEREAMSAFVDHKHGEASSRDTAHPRMSQRRQPPGELTDEEIEQRLRDLLATWAKMDAPEMRVYCVNQMVYLQGTAKTHEDLNILRDMALQLRGVVGVASEVAITAG